MKPTRITILVLAAVLSACGGRVAHPIAEVSPLDTQLSCTHLRGEYDNNVYRIAELSGESRDRITNNAGMLLVSPLFLDLSDTTRRETEALLARNERLVTLLETRDCG